MEYRRLGETDLEPSVIGVGCNRIAAPSRDRREVRASLEAAFERGVTFFDTADSYELGASERLLGEVFRRRRDRVLICSKAGHTIGAMRHLSRRFKEPVKRLLGARQAAARRVWQRTVPRRNFAPDYIRRAVEASLRRLRTDYLDLFLLHGPSPEAVADEALFEMLERLKAAGSIRYYGISCSSHADAAEADAAVRRPGVSAIQVPLNPLARAAFAAACAAGGRGLIVREPFAKGAILEHQGFQRIAESDSRRTPAQWALRYALQHDGVAVVLAGMTTRCHLEENLGALETPPLSADDMARISALRPAP